MPVCHSHADQRAGIGAFQSRGYLRIEGAVPREVTEEVGRILWRDLPGRPEDPTSWAEPVVRLGMYAAAPFAAAARAPVLEEAFDLLVGPGRWQPLGSLGTFRCVFPHREPAPDAGWHIDPSFDFDQPNFLDWRVNIRSKGRALLLLYLFTDVGESDAPTRLRVGSHHAVARLLAPAGEAGMSLGELVDGGIDRTESCDEVLATGPAGTVYVCHPFLVHAASPHHHGVTPRFLAQPPLLPEGDFGRGTSPVEEAIRLALL